MPTILSISQLATRRVPFINLSRQKSLIRRGKINFDDFVSLLVRKKLFLLHSLIFSSSKMFSQQLFASTIWFIMWLDIYRGGYEIIWWHSFVILSIKKCLLTFSLSLVFVMECFNMFNVSRTSRLLQRLRFANKSIKLIKKVSTDEKGILLWKIKLIHREKILL